ncbi:MAG: hypothetical protein FWC34_11025 [Bacteroidetes bacterium]|nr:hypothetical protein [Bacteroidota bacterium]MCL2302926.1 hypothetical protein [Lentimicrobiaceae bacterium]
MTTKIKIKLTRTEYEVIRTYVLHASYNLDVADARSLYEKETLEVLSTRFEAKTYKYQKSYNFSFSIAEMVVFMKHIGEAMQLNGSYERAVYGLLYTQQIAPQITNAVQMRMSFK